jgi:hypothetical protein
MEPQISERLREDLKGKPYEAKWPILRPVIEHLFTVERKTVPQIAKTLREQVAFFATYEIPCSICRMFGLADSNNL